MFATGFCSDLGPVVLGLDSGMATRLLVFGVGLAVCWCACVVADGAVAAETGGFDSTGGGGPAEASDEGPGVADISTGFGTACCDCGGGA